MNQLAGMLGHVPPAAAYGMVALALLIESNLVVGVFVPTLTLMVTAGALAGSGYLSLPVLLLVAAASVVTADFISWRTGRVLGGQLRTGRIGRRISPSVWTRAETLMTRHGGRAVVVARFIPLLRTLVPHFAGATSLRYRAIAPFSIGTASVWAVIEAGSGYLAARGAEKVLERGGPAALAIAAGVIGVIALVVVLRRRRRRCAQQAASLTAAPSPEPAVH